MKKSIILLPVIVVFIGPLMLTAQSNSDKYKDVVTFTGVDALKKVFVIQRHELFLGIFIKNCLISWFWVLLSSTLRM